MVRCKKRGRWRWQWAWQLVNATNASNENLSTLQPSRCDLDPTPSEFRYFAWICTAHLLSVCVYLTFVPIVVLCAGLTGLTMRANVLVAYEHQEMRIAFI